MKRIINNQRGIVLPLVVAVAALTFILTTVTVDKVYFDSKHSIVNQNRTKAYYLARSAVAAVEGAIDAEFNELKARENELRLAVEAEEPDLLLIAQLKDAYDQHLQRIRTQVLPQSAGSTFFHRVDGMSGGAGRVSVRLDAINGDIHAYGLEASASVNGNTARARMKMLIGFVHEEIEVTEEVTRSTVRQLYTTIPKGDPAGFGDAIYTYGDLFLDNNIFLHRLTRTGSPGRGRYQGVFGGKGRIRKGTVVEVPGNQDRTPVDPASLLPVDIAADPRFTRTNLPVLPATITAAHSGYYQPIFQNNNFTYNVDTTGGDVVIMVNRITANNRLRFHVTGPNAFYLYLHDTLSLSDGGFQVKNNFEFTSASNMPQAFLIINQPPNDRGFNNNLVEIKNNMDFFGYIYAPYSSLEIKNNAHIFGSMVAGNTQFKNNLEIIHIPPDAVWESEGENYIIPKGTETRIVREEVIHVLTHITVQYDHEVNRNWLPH